MHAERRNYPRYNVVENAFAITNQDPVRLAPIFDISMEGIGVYLSSEFEWLKQTSTLEIMVADCSFYLEKLPFVSISDFKAFPTTPASLLDGRRYNLKFGTLTASQKSELKYFIRNYTQGNKVWQVMQKIRKLFRPFRANKHSSKSCVPGIWPNLQRPTI